MKKLIAVVATVLMAASLYAAEIPEITIPDLKAAIAAKKVVLLDANDNERYQKGHIPGAVEFSTVKDLSKVLPADKGELIVAYCGGPKCVAYKAAAQAAEKLGYTNVKHFTEGISGWEKAGEKTEKVEKSAKAN